MEFCCVNQHNTLVDFCEVSYEEPVSRSDDSDDVVVKDDGDFSVQVDKTELEKDMTQLPTMTPVPHPAMIGLSPFQQAEIVMSGYRDCATEAIRYLIEVENIAPDDPLVIGLKNHLYEQQKALDLQQLILNAESYAFYFNEPSTLNDSGISVQSDTNDTGHSASESSDMDHTNQLQSFVPGSDVNTSCLNDEHAHSDHTQTSNIIPEDGFQCNNATITALAEEILSLLEEGDSISDTECSDDIEQ